MNLVQFLLWERTPEGGLNGDSVNVGKHLLDDNGIKGVEVEAVTEDKVAGGEFPVGFPNHAEVLAGNEAEEGVVAGLSAGAFPG